MKLRIGKKAILIPLSAVFAYLTLSSNSNGTFQSGTFAGCPACHGASSGSTTISSIALVDQGTGQPVSNGQYTPGTVYTVTLTGANATQPGFGFQLRSTNSSSVSVGTWTATMAATTVSNSLLTHASSGTITSGTATVTGTWTAPASGTGTVTFEAIINAVNLNGNNGGDMVSNVFSLSLTESTPLATQLLDFSGRRAGSDIVLNWSVANEQDLAQYSLLKSTDAKSWSQLTQVTPTAESEETTTHTYADAGAGRDAVAYYRLQLRDHHGVNKYSDILRFSSTGKETGFSLVPNPVRSGNDFVLQKDTHRNGLLTVFSSTGQLIARSAYRQDERISISTRGWVPGTYIVCWEGDGGERYVSRLSVE